MWFLIQPNHEHNDRGGANSSGEHNHNHYNTFLLIRSYVGSNTRTCFESSFQGKDPLHQRNSRQNT